MILRFTNWGGINVNDNNITDVINSIEYNWKKYNTNIEIDKIYCKGTTTTSSTNSAITDTLIELAGGRR